MKMLCKRRKNKIETIWQEKTRDNNALKMFETLAKKKKTEPNSQ